MKLANHIKFIFYLLAILLLLPCLSPEFPVSRDLKAGKSGGSVFLQPQMMSKPIIYFDMGDKGMLGFMVLDSVRRESAVLPSEERPGRDIFADLGPKRIEVMYSKAELLNTSGLSIEGKPAKSFVIPCIVEKTPYFAFLMVTDDGRSKVKVQSREEYEALFAGGQGGLSQEAITRLLSSAENMGLDRPGRIVHIDRTDESVRAVSLFFDKIGSPSLRKKLSDMSSSGKILMAFEPGVFPVGGMAVNSTADERARALSILEWMMADEGVSGEVVSGTFNRYWEAWKKGEAGKFDVDTADPRLKLVARDIEFKRSSGSNEGSIRFGDGAYAEMISLREVSLADCKETIADIKRVFAEVARHEIDDHNAAVAKGEKKHAIGEEDMPGLDPEKILVQSLSDCLLPTDIVEKDGTIRINENFVRLITKLKNRSLQGKKGEVWDYPKTRPPAIVGELYDAILYSVAVHTIRGHFPINEWGFALFNPDESIAQGERGRKHLYINTLAMMYYWVVVVEMHQYPGDRAEFLIDKYPHLFAKLTDAEKAKLPSHLLWLCNQQLDTGAWPFPQYIDDTGTTVEKVEAQMKKFPGSASNEGTPDATAEDNVKAPLGPLDVLEVFYGKSAPVDRGALTAELSAYPAEDIDKCLQALCASGVIKERGPSEARKYVMPIELSGKRTFVQGLISFLDVSDSRTARVAKGLVLAETEKTWAHAILQSFADATRQPAKGEAAVKRILAIETDWVPEEQRSLAQGLLQELEQAGKKFGIRVVRSDGASLSAKLKAAIEEEKTPLKDVLVMGSKDILAGRDFDAMRSYGPGDNDKAFLAVVDAAGLTPDSYVRLAEMLTAAFRMAYGMRPVSDHAEMNATVVNARTIIFMPKAEPIDYRQIQKIYSNQREILMAA